MRHFGSANPQERLWTGASAFLVCLVLCAKTVGAVEQNPSSPILIRSDFPAGNIVVDKIEGNTVRLHQDQRDTSQFWFYWQFEVDRARGQTLTFVFTRGNVFGTRGPAISVDGGRSWDWLGASALQGDSFRYTFARDGGPVRFAFAIPYTQENLRAFLKKHANCAALRQQKLATTPKGRSVELLRAGRLDGKAKFRILLTCRHHACESIANFVLEGCLDSALANTTDGKWFRNYVEIVAAPFMDKDGVEAGDQGKLRRPYDHWLDYKDKSLYAETRALRNLFDQAQEQRSVDVAIDLHCPYLRDNKIYFALGSDLRIAAATQRFCRLFEQQQQGPLVYHSHDDSTFGKGWNVAATYAGRRSFWQWAQTLPAANVVATLEIPYAAIGDVAVTPDNARLLGSDLATALRLWLSSSSR